MAGSADFAKEVTDMMSGIGGSFDDGSADTDEVEDKSSDALADVDDNDLGDVSDEDTDDDSDNDSTSDVDNSTVEDDDSDGDDKYDALMNKIQELEAKLSAKEQDNQKSVEPDILEPTSEALEDLDYFSDVSFEDLIEDENAFKDWFHKSIKKTREADQKSFITSVYKALPKIITSYVQEQVSASQNANAFYESNPDLAEHKQKVAEAANTIAHIKPDLSREEFYKEVASLARYQLGLIEKTVKGNAKPALNNKSKGAKTMRKPPKQLEGFDNEVNEMMKALTGGR